ncbi:hypothetical protein [Amycolatopsis regifaucium]|uniref:Uncharacterized protein n=1 Tax=Amycolatopsis regifaucium TaxID=546365 RepID=A0A154MKH1_9PSEU|nr:hypothetical protein [Amycolatopsis regifaucium]KZB84513.1 hypothetical protein AVL48_32510 [Amycolatopsis regifaucium]OKA10976.1 hypothetical protein ATP06_0202175 [Amycolatopsis regifaucium]SFI24077.1 hypothetical protein SAMN04489731_109180 [Amycolatopsis regifaucium]
MSESSENTGTAHLSLIEEIRLLVELVVEHAAPWLEDVISAGHGCAEHEGDWCPLCAIVEVLRGGRPEVVARLLEQAAQLVALLRAVLADRWEPEGGVHMPGFQPARKEPAREDAPVEASRVQHIAVTRRDAWQPDQEN